MDDGHVVSVVLCVHWGDFCDRETGPKVTNFKFQHAAFFRATPVTWLMKLTTTCQGTAVVSNLVVCHTGMHARSTCWDPYEDLPVYSTSPHAHPPAPPGLFWPA